MRLLMAALCSVTSLRVRVRVCVGVVSVGLQQIDLFHTASLMRLRPAISTSQLIEE